MFLEGTMDSVIIIIIIITIIIVKYSLSNCLEGLKKKHKSLLRLTFCCCPIKTGTGIATIIIVK